MIQSPLKWVGGKGRVVDLILENLPQDFKDYHEPFLGSGIVFLSIKQSVGGDRVWNLADVNPHLICWWKAVQSDFSSLLAELESVSATFEGASDPKESYAALRREFNDRQSLDSRKAALFMFLCRTAFNGLVRYNSKGEFNSAFGRQKSGRHKDAFPIDEAHLLSIHQLLQGDVFFSCRPYHESSMKPRDFGFFDPPYLDLKGRKIDKYAYCSNGFNEVEQECLFDWCVDRDSERSQLMVCNHDTEVVRKAFSRFDFIGYDLTKHFSGVVAARKKTPEVLIVNYKRALRQAP
jgi:DNA adenine methylase